MDETQAHHRKIELQAPADLTYLISKIKDAAQKKLDLHIPPQPPRAEGGQEEEEEEEEDAFRSHVQRLVDEVCIIFFFKHFPFLIMRLNEFEGKANARSLVHYSNAKPRAPFHQHQRARCLATKPPPLAKP